MRCYVCDKELIDDILSEEHIIINAAGGRLKSKDLICQQCNSEFGKETDAALAKQLNFIANQLMIKRERGNPQPVIGKIESIDEELRMLPDGSMIPHKPKYIETREDNRVNISMTVRDDTELRKKAKEIVRKHPQLSIEDILKSAKYQESYIDEPIRYGLTVGGPGVFRAVCKCAVNYFVYKQGDSNFIKPLLNYIRGYEDKEIVWLHYKDNLYELKADECFHMIHLRGNPTERVLYCYVDYFNAYKYIILLNDSYDGAEIDSTYCFDVLNSKVIQKEFLEDYDRATTINFFINKDAKPFEIAQKSFNHTLAISQKRQDDHHRSKLIERVFDNSIGKHAGEVFTEDILNEFLKEFEKTMAPYIAHRLRGKN